MSRIAALFVATLLTLSPVFSWTHGSPAAVNRIIIVMYGQSNMGTMLSAVGGTVPPAASGTLSMDGTGTIGAVPAANGVRTLQNSVAAATGLPNLTIQCEAGGSSLSGFAKGTSIYNTCISHINSTLTAQDKVFIIWDQGEGDADGGVEVPDFYAPTMVQIHNDLTADIGRTTTSAPWLTSAKGSDSGVPGDAAGGQTNQKWQTVKNAQVWAPLYEASGGMLFALSDMDFDRGDGYHYVWYESAKMGARFAQGINTIMGAASPSGLAVFNIAGASVVDATHTSVAVTQNLGMDFTPASGILAFEVSGNNGASWQSSTGVRTDATHVTLTHSSLTTTNARLVRYAWGPAPPNVDFNCDSDNDPPSPVCAASTGLVFDNSALAVPLTPTTWDLRASGGSTLPMPTWRDTNSYSGLASDTTQAISGLQLGPEQVQKFVIVSLSNIDLSFSPLTALTVQPQDFFGNNVGSPVSPSLTPIVRSGSNALLAFSLNVNNANATTFTITPTYSQNPFGQTVMQVWTVPLADLSSTTKTGSNTGTATSAASVNTTLTTSAGGFTVCIAQNSTGVSRDNFTGSISGSALTVSALPVTKALAVGQIISAQAGGGAGTPSPNTTITGGSGSSWTVTPSYATPLSSQPMVNGSGFPTVSSSSGETPVIRWGTSFVGFDSANSAGSASSQEQIAFNDNGNLNLACAAWR